tara:strand:+ start:538 stop:1056 length:519 start_codon:yes stop_codon:yes gene_type:complete
VEGVLMLISSEMAAALGEQVGREYSAAIQYDLISAYFERQALPQLTALYREQANEERFHGKKLLDYVTEAGGVIEIPAIQKQKHEFTSLAEAVQTALDSEIYVTKAINTLMDQAIDENDHLARGMLQWFVDEQLEEVSLQSDLLTVVERAGNDVNYIEQYVAALPQNNEDNE